MWFTIVFSGAKTTNAEQIAVYIDIGHLAEKAH